MFFEHKPTDLSPSWSTSYADYISQLSFTFFFAKTTIHTMATRSRDASVEVGLIIVLGAMVIAIVRLFL
jgi:hypothetical protein